MWNTPYEDGRLCVSCCSIAMEDSNKSPTTRKPIRVWTDGCFDMMHYGHANALRQAKALGDILVVGVHSDAEILKHKGPTVMSEQERYKAVEACKWVDEVVPNAPYVTELEILDKYNCDFCVHGDDIVTSATGEDTYAKVKAAGRFRTVKRTQGISTTDLVGRMLLMTKTHFTQPGSEDEQLKNSPLVEGPTKRSPYTGVSQFLATSGKIVQFSSGREPNPTDRIVYIDGGFDLFHYGHIVILEKARALGDYLIVGVHDDQTINRIRGSNYPIMNLYERVLSVLSCKYVDNVIIGAPYSVTHEMVKQLHISVVVHGSQPAAPDVDGLDPFRVPKELGIYRELESPSSLTTQEIVNRIIRNRLQYEERNKKKEAKEIAEIESRS